jgi:hypothetical protein
MEILNLNECVSFNFLAQSLKRKAKSHSVKFKAFNFELWFYALRFTLFAILVSLCFLNCPAAQAAVGPNYIEQWGITWTFDKNISTDGAAGTYQYGQFANGDYWVKGPVKIISITPESFVGDGVRQQNGWMVPSGVTVNGSMINPKAGIGYPLPGWGHDEGYDSRLGPNNWNSALNVAMGVNSQNPLLVPVHSSLVSAISRDCVNPYTYLKTAAILSVLSEVPRSNSFRPAYCGLIKDCKFVVSDMDGQLPLLGKLAPVDGTPLLSTLVPRFEKPWIDHTAGFTSQSMHPLDNMPDYGRDITELVGQVALSLNLDYTDEQKKDLLIRFVQLGIDNYGIVANGGITVWGADGGHQMGRKFPILFAAAMLNDVSMKAIGEKSGDYLYSAKPGGGNYGVITEPSGKKYRPPDYISFQEDEQTWYVTARPREINVEKCKGLATSATANTIGVYNAVDYTFLTGCYIEITSGPGLGQRRYITDMGGDALAGPRVLTVSPAWNTIPVVGVSYYEVKGYENQHIGMPEWGISSVGDSDRDSPSMWASYRALNGYVWYGEVLAAHIMGLKGLWNNNAFFDYQDRYVQLTSPDGEYSNIAHYKDAFAHNMWHAYRANYGPVYIGLNPVTHERIYESGQVILYGDVSGDSALSAYDAALCARIAVGLDAYPTGDNLIKADVSGGGGVTAYDAALIAQRAVGLISKFPVE